MDSQVRVMKKVQFDIGSGQKDQERILIEGSKRFLKIITISLSFIWFKYSNKTLRYEIQDRKKEITQDITRDITYPELKCVRIG